MTDYCERITYYEPFDSPDGMGGGEVNYQPKFSGVYATFELRGHDERLRADTRDNEIQGVFKHVKLPDGAVTPGMVIKWGSQWYNVVSAPPVPSHQREQRVYVEGGVAL